jgi:hypothetical protein
LLPDQKSLLIKISLFFEILSKMPGRRGNAVVQPFIFVINILVAIFPILLGLLRDPEPYHDSALTGQMRYDELMNSPNEHRFSDETRMSKDCFIKLINFMKTRGMLLDSTHICAGQKLMIYITLLKGGKKRGIHSMWQHSGSTISNIIDEVLAAFELVQDVLCIAPPVGTPDYILNSPKYFPWFGNCIGALDGSHIHACYIKKISIHDSPNILLLMI